MQGESKLEADHQILAFDMSPVADVREQALFRFGWRDEKRHWFDMLVTMQTGERVAVTVKPTDRLASGRFIEEMQTIAWWVQKKKFASSVRLLTEQDIDPIALYNANLKAAARDVDPEARAAAREVAKDLRGAVSIKTLTDQIGLKERGYRALLQLVAKDELRPICFERVTPATLVEWNGYLK